MIDSNHLEHKSIRPLVKMINSAAGSSECAAKGVEEEEEEPDMECHPCGDGLDGN